MAIDIYARQLALAALKKGSGVSVRNLFVRSAGVENRAIDISTGDVTELSGNISTSDFISVDVGSDYYSTVEIIRIAYYDKNKNFISSDVVTSNPLTINISNARYVRFSYDNSITDEIIFSKV